MHAKRVKNSCSFVAKISKWLNIHDVNAMRAKNVGV